jgi:SRSO17 transposase
VTKEKGVETAIKALRLLPEEAMLEIVGPVDPAYRCSVQEMAAAFRGRAFILCIDETGDRKKGKTTDYVAHHYIGNLGKLANGMVSVNAYGILDHITFPLLFKVYKPKTRLQPGDTYKSKPELAVEIIKELQQWGFRFEVVLADSLSGESGDFISELEKLGRKLRGGDSFQPRGWLPRGATGALHQLASF